MKGIYVLVVSVDRDIYVKVGALGEFFFEKGVYAYVGSAQNSLEKRVDRHLTEDKQKFWHIDYLLDNEAAKVVDVFWKEASKSEECKVAGKLGERGVPTMNFGCSDCSCVSHLFMLGDKTSSRCSKPFLEADFVHAEHIES